MNRSLLPILLLVSSSVASAQPDPAQPLPPDPTTAGDQPPPTPTPPTPPAPVPTVGPIAATPPAPVVDTSSPGDVPVQEQTSAPAGITTGFALELRLEAGQAALDDDFVLPTTEAGLLIGYRMPSVTIGVGFAFSRMTQGRDDSMQSTEDSITTIMLIPGLRAVLARSADTKTELLGTVDLGYGAVIRSPADPSIEVPNVSRLRVQGGLGLRYWVSSSFAFGGTGGLRYDRSSLENESFPGMTSEQRFVVTNLYGSFQVTGVF